MRNKISITVVSFTIGFCIGTFLTINVVKNTGLKVFPTSKTILNK